MEKELRTYICIDLKSFYASVECAERGLDPFITDLVVADPERSKSTICLAITPAMKQKGVKNRCRIHEIPPNISYITAVPRMQKYIDYSAKIYSIYLRYLAPEDIHVYSIDECFMDVTTYLELYRLSSKSMAQFLMNEVMRETKITATAGIGTNLYLAKVAMDILAKHSSDHIGILNETTYREKLWNHEPLSDFWQIGRRTQRKLNQYGIRTMGDLAKFSIVSENLLYKIFGIDAELMIDHAWGQESCLMKDIKSYRSKEHSLSNGQVLMRNYSFEEARVVVKEMTDILVLDMVKKRVITDSIELWIAYDHRFNHPDTGATVHLDTATNSSKRIISSIEKAYTDTTNPLIGIRRITITANRIRSEDYQQFDFFSNPMDQQKEKQIQHCILDIKKKYGKNAIMRGCNLLECSTYRMRNEQIGGHKK